MRDIFANATQVIIWLGDEDSQMDNRSVLNALNKLSSHWIDEHKSGPFPNQGWRKKWSNGPVQTGGSSPRILEDTEREDLRRLLRRSWFRRSWVVQEVAMARYIVVRFGAHSTLWSAFEGIYADLQDQKELVGQFDDETVRHACTNIATMEYARRTYHSKFLRPSLFELLVDTQGNECTDVRDKIFSVLGLAADWLNLGGLRPDYSPKTNFEAVCTRFAIWDIKNNDSLRVLSCAIGPRDHERQSNMPSWAPDWTRIENPNPFVRYSKWTRFDASRRQSMPIQLGKAAAVLRVSGKIVDSAQI